MTALGSRGSRPGLKTVAPEGALYLCPLIQDALWLFECRTNKRLNVI